MSETKQKPATTTARLIATLPSAIAAKVERAAKSEMISTAARAVASAVRNPKVSGD
jgi:hypothetical protein